MIKCLALNQLKMIPKNVKNHSNCASGITSTTHSRISKNVSVGFLISELLNGPAAIPYSKVVTITFLACVWRLDLQRLFFPLPHDEKFIQHRRLDLVYRELFSKQS